MSSNTLVVFGVGLLAVLAGGVTLLALMLLWRNGFVRGWRASRGSPPRCPHCGYNLSGLTHCRCPECGRESTVDKVVATAERSYPFG